MELFCNLSDLSKPFSNIVYIYVFIAVVGMKRLLQIHDTTRFWRLRTEDLNELGMITWQSTPCMMQGMMSTMSPAKVIDLPKRSGDLCLQERIRRMVDRTIKHKSKCLNITLTLSDLFCITLLLLLIYSNVSCEVKCFIFISIHILSYQIKMTKQRFVVVALNHHEFNEYWLCLGFTSSGV